MPVLKTIHKDNGSMIGIWHITESPETLKTSLELNEIEKARFSALKKEKRKKEWLAVRCLLKAIYKDSVHILYAENGKPGLSNSSKISISHSGNYAALIIHPTDEVGIDIQVPKPNIESASQLFMTPGELEQLPSGDYKDLLHLYWCAKEAIYKKAGNTNLNIYSDIKIFPFNLKKHTITGQTKLSPTILELEFYKNTDFYLVYT